MLQYLQPTCLHFPASRLAISTHTLVLPQQEPTFESTAVEQNNKNDSSPETDMKI